jgi:hypothetical protein
MMAAIFIYDLPIKSLSDIDSMRAAHPEWAERVKFVAINVDDAKEDAARLLSKQRWPNLSFGWTGPNVLGLYRVASLPTVYIIDQAGSVVAVDHRLDIAASVGDLLRRSNEPRKI